MREMTLYHDVMLFNSCHEKNTISHDEKKKKEKEPQQKSCKPVVERYSAKSDISML